MHSDRPLAIYVFANDEKVKDKGSYVLLYCHTMPDSSCTVRTETISGSMAFNEVVLQVASKRLCLLISTIADLK